ncbi:hypothetical protein SEVIR_7G100450v4 [Setaria viridis]
MGKLLAVFLHISSFICRDYVQWKSSANHMSSGASYCNNLLFYPPFSPLGFEGVACNIR